MYDTCHAAAGGGGAPSALAPGLVGAAAAALPRLAAPHLQPSQERREPHDDEPEEIERGGAADAPLSAVPPHERVDDDVEGEGAHERQVEAQQVLA